MAGGQFQRYVSGGADAGDSNIDLDQTDNVVAGLMGFLGQLGVRADLRYFKVSGNEFAGVDSSVLRSAQLAPSSTTRSRGSPARSSSAWRM